jgi:hypothetical protein
MCADSSHFVRLSKDAVLDGSTSPYVTTYLNHSCRPNCVMEKWTRGVDERVVVFTLVALRAGTELTVDYGVAGDVCHCGQQGRRGVIGASSSGRGPLSRKRRRAA